ncbi:MAG: hypothetical protein EF812_00035 [Methanosarcinales archaeon]|nr:MAG: hypothetical protein EF812_00035 [Methanosarcinales archaeon]
MSDERILQSEYTCKYVKHGAEKIGESIAVSNGVIIVKSEEGTLAIPVEKVKRTTENDIILKDFNESEAKTYGEEWLNTNTNKLEFDEEGMLKN